MDHDLWKMGFYEKIGPYEEEEEDREDYEFEIAEWEGTK